MISKYLSQPTVSKNNIAFISEDDLWLVEKDGGNATRLTNTTGVCSQPMFSPDGTKIAYSSLDEGHKEVFILDLSNFETERLTYLASNTYVTHWVSNEKLIINTIAYNPHMCGEMFKISVTGGQPEPFNLGPCTHFSQNEQGQVVIERNSRRADLSWWKRYRGGTAGKLWTSTSLTGEYQQILKDLDSNFSRPLFIGDKIYFLSDHENIANIYSCNINGSQIERVTNFEVYYCRNLQSNGQELCFQNGAQLYTVNLSDNTVKKLEVTFTNSTAKTHRKLVPADERFTYHSVHPNGEHIAMTSRGHNLYRGVWDGPTQQIPQDPTTRSLHVDWAKNNLIRTRDLGTKYIFELYNYETETVETTFDQFDFGRIINIKAAPSGKYVAFTNHRNEIGILNLTNSETTIIDQAKSTFIKYMNWSPDSKFLAYEASHKVGDYNFQILVHSLSEKKTYPVTNNEFKNFSPSFSPDGKYLWFISNCFLNPYYDNVNFDMSFRKTSKICGVTLAKETLSPLFKSPKFEAADPSKNETKNKDQEVTVAIDFENIQHRVFSLPVPEFSGVKLEATEKKVYWQSYNDDGALNMSWDMQQTDKCSLNAFTFEDQKTETYPEQVGNFNLYGKSISLMQKKQLRILSCESKLEIPKEKGFNKASGLVDLKKSKVMIQPKQEWKQMFFEMWNLQKDYFWRSDMSQINWSNVLEMYSPLLEKINTRSEFSDLCWEVQGELGTSHAYESGGDYEPTKSFHLGLFGCDLKFNEKQGGYEITNIIKADTWNEKECSPLMAPGLNISEGDFITKVNNTSVSATQTPTRLTLASGIDFCNLTVKDKNSKKERTVIVKPYATEVSSRYREWVNKNREYVHAKSGGKVGYVHIPNMVGQGFSEFHRLFIPDVNKEALVVDVRYNRGGHVSPLLIEKLARTKHGVCESRWFGTTSVPAETPKGPLVCITNEFAGSDGDIFSHTFKLKNLGPLIGKRTWGGVIGIYPRNTLVDGGMTTQPEFSYWFKDTGWSVENYGTDPTIDVDYSPNDYMNGIDPQLDRGIEEAMSALDEKGTFKPEIGPRPNLSTQQ